MLTTTDVMAGKIAVQLGLAPAEDVRAALRAVDADSDFGDDLLNRLADTGRLDAKAVELLRQRAALYQHVRAESSYVRLLEKHASYRKAEVAELIAGIERSAFRRRLGDVLVQKGRLTKQQDALLTRAQKEALDQDDARILDRYRKEDFAGVARPLVPGSRLEPDDFKISTLFRSRDTRARIDRAKVHELLADLAPLAAPAPGAAEPPGDEGEAEAAPPAKGMDRVRALQRIANYSIVEVLGVGGMGAVFLAQQDGRGEYNAIKVMLQEAASEEERARFAREIELTRRIQHRNVIGIIDSGATDDGLEFLVVPALAGKELRSLLKRAPKGLAPDLALRIFEQVLEGMQALHDAGIVHRDMKPENVFVLAGREHEVKIMDLGLARLMDEPARRDREASRYFKRVTGRLGRKITGALGPARVMGSPAYIAPEAITGDAIDARTDIYSLGATFFEMLTGLRVFESDSPQDYLVMHLVNPPLTLHDARPEVPWPKDLDRLIGRMLGKTRDERPSSCKEILAELRGGLGAALVKSVGSRAEAAPATASSEQSGFGWQGLIGRLWSKGP